MDTSIQQFYLILLQGLILLVISWIGIGVRSVYAELRALNGRLIRIEEWKETHVLEIDIHQSNINDRLDALRDDIKSLRLR